MKAKANGTGRKMLAVVSGRVIFPMCSTGCQGRMIAANPPGTCKAETVARRKQDDICSMCYAPLPEIDD